MKEEENHTRSLFLLDPDCAELQNPVHFLVDIFDKNAHDTFKEEADLLGGENIPLMFTGKRVVVPGRRRYVPQDLSQRSSVCDSLKTFEKQWDAFTGMVFRNMDWNNVFAAGGSVLASLLPIPDDYSM